MEDKFKGLCFGEVMEMLDDCNNPDEKIEIYRKLVELGEEVLGELEEELCIEPIDTNWFPADLDLYAGSMDNLAFCYMERKEYAKAIPLLERALQLYRIQEFYKPIFTYQRYYALKKLAECYKALGNKTMAILYEHEQRLLERTYSFLCENSQPQ